MRLPNLGGGNNQRNAAAANQQAEAQAAQPEMSPEQLANMNEHPPEHEYWLDPSQKKTFVPAAARTLRYEVDVDESTGISHYWEPIERTPARGNWDPFRLKTINGRPHFLKRDQVWVEPVRVPVPRLFDPRTFVNVFDPHNPLGWVPVADPISPSPLSLAIANAHHTLSGETAPTPRPAVPVPSGGIELGGLGTAMAQASMGLLAPWSPVLAQAFSQSFLLEALRPQPKRYSLYNVPIHPFQITADMKPYWLPPTPGIGNTLPNELRAVGQHLYLANFGGGWFRSLYNFGNDAFVRQDGRRHKKSSFLIFLGLTLVLMVLPSRFKRILTPSALLLWQRLPLIWTPNRLRMFTGQKEDARLIRTLRTFKRSGRKGSRVRIKYVPFFVVGVYFFYKFFGFFRKVPPPDLILDWKPGEADKRHEDPYYGTRWPYVMSKVVTMFVVFLYTRKYVMRVRGKHWFYTVMAGTAASLAVDQVLFGYRNFAENASRDTIGIL